MPGSGYEPACGRRRGGIESLAFVAAAAVESVEYDQDKCRAITFAGDAQFVSFVFREEEAYYTEEMTCGSGPALVTHTLAFSLEMMDGASATAIRRLAADQKDGLVAVVGMADGTRLLAGCSPRFGTAYPMRISSVRSSSGLKAGDTPERKLVLVSRDTQAACQLSPSLII